MEIGTFVLIGVVIAGIVWLLRRVGEFFFHVEYSLKDIVHRRRLRKEVLAAIASGSDLCKARLAGAALHRGDADGVRLFDVKLRGVDLTGMGRGSLYRANLRGADLRGANLSGMDLGRAYLYRADLRGADLRGAYLREADMRDARLYEADLSGAKYNAYTKWPDDFDPEAAGMVLVN